MTAYGLGMMEMMMTMMMMIMMMNLIYSEYFHQLLKGDHPLLCLVSLLGNFVQIGKQMCITSSFSCKWWSEIQLIAIFRMSKENSREICQMLCFPWYEWIFKRNQTNLILKLVLTLYFESLNCSLGQWLSARQRKWEDLVTTNYQCFSSMGCSS